MEYRHIWQGEPELLTSLKSRFPSYTGVCWLVSLEMAVQALLTPKGWEPEDIQNRLWSLLSYPADQFAKRIEAMAQSGFDMEWLLSLENKQIIDLRTGNIWLHQAVENSHLQLSKLFTQILAEDLGLPLLLEFVCLYELKGNRYFDSVIKALYEHKSVLLFGKLVRDDAISGHVVAVNEAIDNTNEPLLLVSDPNLPEPIRLSRRDIVCASERSLRYDSETNVMLSPYCAEISCTS